MSFWINRVEDTSLPVDYAKNLEESEILLYSQANNWASLVSRVLEETWDFWSETKGFVAHGTTSSKRIGIVASVPLVLKSHRSSVDGPRWHVDTQGVALQERNPELK